MLGHRHGDLRQLLDLPAHRLTDRHAFALREDVTTLAVLRPMLAYLIHGAGRQQPSTATVVTGLGALRTTRWILPAPGRALGGSQLGGCELLRELRPSRRSNCAIRSSCPATRSANICIRASMRNNTSTTTSRPAS